MKSDKKETVVCNDSPLGFSKQKYIVFRKKNPRNKRNMITDIVRKSMRSLLLWNVGPNLRPKFILLHT